jgi:penicillin-binding protein 2
VRAQGTGVRLGALGLVAVSLFAALFVRLWYLQVLDSGHLQVAAQSNGVRLVYQPAPRGRILDRQGRPIVDNKLVDELTVDRAMFAHHPEIAGRLAGLLTTPARPWTAGQVAQLMADPRFTPVQPVPIAPVTTPTAVYLAEHADQFPGVGTTDVIQRNYPYGSLAAHLVGYVGAISPAELSSRLGEGYRAGDQIGKSGIELAYDSVLRGTPGVTRMAVDARGNPLGVVSRTDPVPGHDVRLTIDLDIQRSAEAALAQGLQAARGTSDASQQHFVAPAGAAVVVDPRDGSVLALASNPTYDPSQFVDGIPTALYQQLQAPASNAPLVDRATSGVYAPGSTFKLVTGTAALATGLIDPHTTIDDPGSVRIGAETLHNAGGASYGPVNVTRALTVSSDVFFYTLGAQFWNDRSQYGEAIQTTARAYGLGQPTGVGVDGDPSGRIPDPATRQHDHQANPTAFPDGGWFTGDNVNLAIGQGDVGVTPLQLADAYAAFADGGTLYQPRVVSAVLGPSGQPASVTAAHVVHRITFAPGAHDAILAGLEGAVMSPQGTAYGAFAGFPLAQFPVAGKTGTAQVDGKQDTSLFTAFAPADHPRYVVTVVEEQAGFGASSSAPVARQILDGLTGSAGQ